jgi:cell division inhibitor SepF
MAGVWRKTLIYLGLVEDDELEEYAYEEIEPERTRRGARRSEPAAEQVVRPLHPTAPAMFHLVQPTTFNDAQEVGDKFRDGYSVLMNTQGIDASLRRRLIDFASGLAYGLSGSMKPVANNVFLITPPGVQVSAEERRRLLEERGFFNQA